MTLFCRWQFATFRRVFHIAIARMALDGMQQRLGTSGVFCSEEQESMLMLLSFALIADANGVNALRPHFNTVPSNSSAGVALAWLTMVSWSMHETQLTETIVLYNLTDKSSPI